MRSPNSMTLHELAGQSGNTPLLGHELVHTQQYQDAFGGVPGMAANYLGQYLINRLSGMSHQEAYENISYEAEAYASQDEILNQIGQFEGASDICPNVCD